MSTFREVGVSLSTSVARNISAIRVKHGVARASRTKLGFHVPIGSAEAIFSERLITTINPGKLRHSLSQPGNTFLKIAKNYFIGTGDWNKRAVPVIDILSYREIRDLFNCNFEYKNAASYKERISKLSSGTIVSQNGSRLNSVDAINRHFQNLIGLIQSIRALGYIDRRTICRRLLKGQSSLSHRTMKQEEQEREICVAVGPAGELFLFRSGHHRLAIAHALNLTAIPIQIHFVHEEFLAADFEQQSFDIEQMIDAVMSRLEARYAVPITV